MRSLGFLGAFLGGAVAGAVIGLLVAPEKGADTRVKITDAVEDFLKKHNIKLSMLSSDKNVESIGQLVEALKAYVGLQKEYLELNAIEKVVRLVTALTVAIVFVILGFAVLFFLTFALVYWLAPITGLALAFLLVALLFVGLLALVCMFRKKWIEQPLVRFLANTLLN